MLYSAMRKYGIDNFSFEIIEECSASELDEKEIWWIEHYNSCIYNDNSKGYNMTPGGGEKFYNPEQFYKLWDDGLSPGQIAEKLKCSPTTVRGYLTDYKNYEEEHNKRGGIVAAQTAILNNKREAISPLGTINQYSLSGEFIKTWSSCKEIERELGISACSIGKVLNGKRNSAGNFLWTKNNEVPKVNAKVWQEREIEQYDLNDNYITTYKNIKEAAEAMNCTPTNIGHVLNNSNRKTACGYKWKYKE